MHTRRLDYTMRLVRPRLTFIVAVPKVNDIYNCVFHDFEHLVVCRIFIVVEE